MKRLRKQSVRQVTALLMMAILLSIQAIKLFHTHAPSAQTDHAVKHVGGAYLEQDGHCAICDFQMAKDAVVPDMGIILTPLDFQRIQYTAPLFAVQHLTLIATSGLAPPWPNQQHFLLVKYCLFEVKCYYIFVRLAGKLPDTHRTQYTRLAALY